MQNTVILSSKQDFLTGQLEHLSLNEGLGRGALVLDKDVREGIFTSPEMETTPFTTLVMSWNTDTPLGTQSEALCRVRDETGAWSDWLSWGIWSPHLRRSSRPATDGGCAECETDTLTMKDGHLGMAIQLRCILRRSSEAGEAVPALRLLAATFRQSRDERFGNTMEPILVDNPAPAYCQGIRDPNIGFGMCSPTTATVLMNARGADLLPEETALACWDYAYEGFGNWAFTMAAAGSFGYECWLSFTDADGIRRELLSGNPVGVSVAYAPTPERATEHSPYMEGTPGFTAGHLMTVRGMTVENGREMVLVNDSYGNPDSMAFRKYPLDQFLQCWGGLIYCLRAKTPGAGYGAPHRVPAKLVKTDFGDEFRLLVDGNDLPVPPLFNGSRKHCTGIIAYTLTDPYNYATTANRPFSYTKSTANGNVFLPARQLLSHAALGDQARILVYVITNHGITYTAQLSREDL
ncbi:MAG: C39 family peptidase [Clostridia bacterium]|nr:C39 family peptidase [Clostridia bacterium]